ncbi:MAG TPA: hypothetical protein VLA13_05700 [Massilibacterium sp.]|nr:hypothetical protein [Massilibacterium sp.]
MKVYAVMKMTNKVDVNGITSELPKGEHFIPVFEDRKKAEKHANGKFVVMPMEVPNNPLNKNG